MPTKNDQIVQAVASAGAETAKPATSSILNFLSANPPSWVLWVTTGIVVATFLWRIYVFIVERREKREERRLSVEDEFWHRLIISPICILPFVEFVKEFTSELRTIHSQDNSANKEGQADRHKAFLDKFKKTKDAVLNRFIILDSADGGTYATVANGLDEIDDVITQHCVCYILDPIAGEGERKYNNISIAEQAVYSRLREIFGGLKRNHAQMFDRTERGRTHLFL